MKTNTNSNEALPADERPLSRLPNGKSNPAYQKWRRAKYPEQYVKLRNKWSAVRMKKLHDELGRVERQQAKCLECGRIVTKEDALVELWRYMKNMGPNAAICNECN